jgi:hypothetical protein
MLPASSKMGAFPQVLQQSIVGVRAQLCRFSPEGTDAFANDPQVRVGGQEHAAELQHSILIANGIRVLYLRAASVRQRTCEAVDDAFDEILEGAWVPDAAPGKLADKNRLRASVACRSIRL